MLSLNTRFTTISPAQYQRINQASLLVLITTAALAPAWVNIIVSAGYALMNWLTFKRFVIGIIDRVLSDIPGLPVQRRVAERFPDIVRPARPRSGNTHLYLGDGLYSRYGTIGRPGRRGRRVDRQFRKGGDRLDQ
jgi:hypothetical protein